MTGNGSRHSPPGGATTLLAPWEADPSWHPARRGAFVAYRDMPERSYPKVARELSKSTTLIKRWASEDGWQDRVRAWDGECDRRRRDEFINAAADVARRQAEDAAELRVALMAPAHTVVERMERLRAEGEDPLPTSAGAVLPDRLRPAVSSFGAGGARAGGDGVMTLRRRLVSRIQVFPERAQALEAAGPRE